MNEAERKFKEKGSVSIKATVPLIFWEEWEKDCKANFNNTRFLKMQYDHKYRLDMQLFIDSIIVDMVSLKDQVYELKTKLSALEQSNSKSNVQETQAAKTMGGNV